MLMTPLMLAKERERRNGNMSESLLQAAREPGEVRAEVGEMEKIKSSG